jgi:hypothetical protein
LATGNNKVITNTAPTVDANFPSVTGTTVGAKHGIDVTPVSESIRWDTTSTASVIYVGFSAPGSVTSAASWRIMKVSTASNYLQWADGDDLYNNIWDNRTGLTYS